MVYLKMSSHARMNKNSQNNKASDLRDDLSREMDKKEEEEPDTTRRSLCGTTPASGSRGRRSLIGTINLGPDRNRDLAPISLNLGFW